MRIGQLSQTIPRSTRCPQPHLTPTLIQLGQNSIESISDHRFDVAVIGSQRKHVGPVDAYDLRLQLITRLLLGIVFMIFSSVDLNRKQHSLAHLVVYSKIDSRRRTNKFFLPFVQSIGIRHQVAESHL